MITITVTKESFLYNIYHMIKAFYPAKEITSKVDEKASHFVKIQFDEGEDIVYDFFDKKIIDKELYRQLVLKTKTTLPWGMLMGIRPTKLVTADILAGMTKEEIIKKLKNERFVSEEKALLAYEIAKREEEILKPLNLIDGYSFYVGIPFCPSVCSYCSFSSGEYKAHQDVVPGYLNMLCEEIKIKANQMKDQVLDTVYIGGGTPTALSVKELEKVLKCVKENLDLKKTIEFTVEAGRPDSITKEKLELLKEYGVGRISINPQTMRQKTLDLVGRKHTVEDTIQRFHEARELGFDNINMDLILGLPGETIEDVKETMKQIEILNPDSLTVHTLAIKRSSRLSKVETPAKIIEEMVDYSYQEARTMKLLPYYLYRQKNIGGNFENIGYAKVDKAGIYNILIMEEKQSIIACGVGATTKIKLKSKQVIDGKETNLIRKENVKSIKQYIERGKDQWL